MPNPTLLTEETALEMALKIHQEDYGITETADTIRDLQQIGYKLGQIAEVETNAKKNCDGCRDNIPFENVEYRFAHRISKYGVSICESSRDQIRLHELRAELEAMK